MTRHLRSLSAKLKKTFGRHQPIGLQLEITNYCNFHCKMCPFHAPGVRKSRQMGFILEQEYRKILTDFVEMGGQILIPQGAGESFLHPEIVSLLEIAKTEFHLDIGLNTNGSRISRDVLEKIVDLGIEEIGFSIDAYSPETFQYITGSDLLEDVERNVQYLVYYRTKKNAVKPLIRTLIVEQDENSHEIELFTSKWVNIVDEVVVLSKRVESGRKLLLPRKEKRKPCLHLFETIFVQWDGDIVICCEDWESKSVLGNIRDFMLRDLWFGSEMKSYRQAQKQKIYFPPEICRNCEAWVGGAKKRIKTSNCCVDVTALTRTYRKIT